VIQKLTLCCCIQFVNNFQIFIIILSVFNQHFGKMSLKLVKSDTSISASKILDNLNEVQLQAVTTINGPLLIVAGAGSGKTRVLTHRIAYLIEQGIAPHSIIALTFTNKAAEEMKERITNLVSFEASRKIWAGTFHSIFARVLRTEAELLGYTNSFSIYDSDDSLSQIKNVMNTLNISTQTIAPQEARSKISWAKSQLLSVSEFENSAQSYKDEIIAKIYQGYENSLKVNNAMDFDDLLNNFIKLLQSSGTTLNKYQNIFKYILVDEYQDTNRSQYTAINLLAGKNKNICVVGDDAQSIYRWRGADIRNILDFQKDYPEAQIIRLEQNYRSTKTIIGAADNVIRHNSRQIPKKLWTDNPEGDKIEILNNGTDTEEAKRIIELIIKLKKSDNYTNKDFSVLYRTNAQSLAFENACRSVNLPYIIIGGMSFYKRKEVKDVLSYLKLLVNPKDSESLLRIVNEPPRGLGATSIQHIKSFAKDCGITLFEAFSRADEILTLQNRAKTAAVKFANFIKKYGELRLELTPDQLSSDYISESGLQEMYKEIDTEDSLDRWNNIQQMLDDIALFIEKEPERNLVDYIQQISLVSDIDEKDMTQEQVRIMTLHAAKGLEFPVVFIAGIEQGLLPLTRIDSFTEEIEEERRLFYVGITRAEKKLYLSHAARRMRFGEYQKQSRSQFLKEIDSSFLKSSILDRIDDQSAYKQPYKPANIHFDDIPQQDNYSQIEPEPTKIRTGSIVNHHQFGIGKVEIIMGNGTNTQATVYFKSVGRKKLLLQYAKLKVVG